MGLKGVMSNSFVNLWCEKQEKRNYCY